jgi:hypothetical protein
MPRINLRIMAAAAVVLSALCAAPVSADDFGDIVHHIEVRYHAHRNFRFLMACAGLTFKMWQGSGVRDVKIALFENQNLFRANPDREIEDILRNTGKTGWQPMVKSYSHKSGDRVYIYGQPPGADKEVKLLIVNIEHNEAEVIQVKVDPDKLEKFIGRHEPHGHDDTM